MFEALLYTLKQEMLPLCSSMAYVAKAIAMLGCFVSFAMITLKALSTAESIDVMTFLKPLLIVFSIVMFEPLVIGVLDGIMIPVAKATSAIAAAEEVNCFEATDRIEEAMAKEYPSSDVIYYLAKRERDALPRMAETEGAKRIEEADFKEIARRHLAAEKEYQKTIFTAVLEAFLDVLSAAVRLIINLVGTFFLLILSVLGPLAFAAACFPMFENSISTWVSRYVSISLWLPIANLFTAILSRAQLMLSEKQLEGISSGQVVNTTLLLAMTVVGIFGYFSIPSIASWVIQAGGSGSYSRNLTNKGNEAAGKGSHAVSKGVKNLAGKAASVKSSVANLMKGEKYGV